MLWHLEGRPAPAHELPQCASDVRSSEHKVAARLDGFHKLAHERDRIVNVFNYLDSHSAVERYIIRKLFDSSDKHMGPRLTSAGRAVLGKLRSDSTPKITPRFVQEIAVATADLEKITARHPTSLEIAEQRPESCPQGGFLIDVAGVRIAGAAALVVARVTVNLLHRLLG